MSTIEQQVTDAFNGKGWPAGKDGPSMLLDAAAELRRVRQELSLAEEGLANYQQENGQLKEKCADLESDYLRRHKDAVDRFEEIERLRAALADLRKGIEEHATDTVWYSPIETACDRITAILGDQCSRTPQTAEQPSQA